MKLRIKKKSPAAVTNITRIEVRSGSSSRVLTLEHVNAHSVYKHIRDKLAAITEPIKIELPIIESPVGHISKCRIQIFEATTEAVTKKQNFKSFTCYGIDTDKAIDLITKIIQAN